MLKDRKDVQFFREASDVQFDETGNRKRKYRYGDEDEIELEQQERKRRQTLNREFKAFAEKVAEAATVAVSSPVRTNPSHMSDTLLSAWRYHRDGCAIPRALVRGCPTPDKCPSTTDHGLFSVPL